MEISKKKKSEFDNVIKLENHNNFILDIEQLRKLFSSDFYEKFVFYVETKVSDIVKIYGEFYLHIDTNLLCMNDLLEYNKILIFSNMLHKFTLNLKQIYIYNSSSLITNLIYLINTSLGTDITQKITFK